MLAALVAVAVVVGLVWMNKSKDDKGGAGTATAWYVASDDILDFVFDYNDDFYVETTDDVITWVDSSLNSESVFLSSITGDAKITISADGYLFRMIGAPTGAASYEEYPLSN